MRGLHVFTGQVLELSYLHSRDVTFAVFCQGPYEESSRYRDFMGWQAPWYSVPAESLGSLVAGRAFGMKVCYLRKGDRVFETYWTTARGCEAMAPPSPPAESTTAAAEPLACDPPAARRWIVGWMRVVDCRRGLRGR